MFLWYLNVFTSHRGGQCLQPARQQVQLWDQQADASLLFIRICKTRQNRLNNINCANCYSAPPKGAKKSHHSIWTTLIKCCQLCCMWYTYKCVRMYTSPTQKTLNHFHFLLYVLGFNNNNCLFLVFSGYRFTDISFWIQPMVLFCFFVF